MVKEIKIIQSRDKRLHFSYNDVYQFSLEVIKKANYSDSYADATAKALLWADARGIFSHGTAGGTGLEEAVKRSGITETVIPTAKPIILPQKYPTLAVIDGNGAPGHITSEIAVDLVKSMARKYGIAKVIVNNTNHYGAAGVWSERIAEDGDLKGEVSCTTVACVKPIGDDDDRIDYTIGAGTELRTGTNPLAISIPHSDGILTLDMAFTKMAVSYCLKHLKANEMMSIPEYIADENYKSTLNPKDFVDSMEELDKIKGTVFPLGSTHSGYKGDMMLRILEVDQSLGGGPIHKIPFKGEGDYRRISLSFQAQAIDFHYNNIQAKDRVSQLMEDYEQYFGPASRWSGVRANQAFQYSKTQGIPYSTGQINTLRRSAESVGLDFDTLIQPISEKSYPANLFNK
ncbi:MAG: Ldh family oxidoreductase [Candidatus Heimdallarchaeota archaeon]|nr:Ldh family oxidoreductase [Candidatus Heimdallarchaeota archaeon]MDH5645115.1 Ldh family oxidoreductase [Candidatus Heimdallarchaeota archaeon]